MSANVLQNEFTALEKVFWEKWKQGADDGLTDAEIGKQIHRTPRTVRRLKRKAKANGEYQKWIDDRIGRFHEEYWQLHRRVKRKNPELAYIETGKRVDKTLIAKIKIAAELEAKITAPPPIDLGELTDYEHKLLTDAALLYWRERNRSRQRESVSIH